MNNIYKNKLKKLSGIFMFLVISSFASSPVFAAELSSEHSRVDSNPFKIQLSGKAFQLAATTKKKPARKAVKRSSRVRGADFDHLATGFPLSGAHNRAECTTCHVSGVFKGTPTKCAGCHDLGRARASTKKPSNHVRTVGECDQCHNTQTWTGARFDHAIIAPGTCSGCHNGGTATGKHGGHMVTTDSCDVCHTTRAWIPAGFNHSAVAPGTCATCHNGSTATGKPGGHVVTNSSCDVCHTTRAWLPASYDHTLVAPGTCLTCHGVTATGKPGGHVVTVASCDACHSTDRWLPANTYDHTAVAPGTCVICHNGGTASGLPGGHFSTARSCDDCHRLPPTNWSSTKPYTHLSGFYPGRHNSDVTCKKCHKGNSEVIVYENTTYLGFCASCHALKFMEKDHKKVDSPKLLYSLDNMVDNIKDCRVACHRYTDSTFTTVEKERKAGKHNVSDGGW